MIDGDLNKDCDLDLTDLAILTENWLAGKADLFIVDLDDNGRIDMLDLDRLAGRWLQMCSPYYWCDRCDINKTGLVNFVDYAIFAANRLED